MDRRDKSGPFLSSGLHWFLLDEESETSKMICDWAVAGQWMVAPLSWVRTTLAGLSAWKQRPEKEGICKRKQETD